MLYIVLLSSMITFENFCLHVVSSLRKCCDNKIPLLNTWLGDRRYIWHVENLTPAIAKGSLGDFEGT